MLLATNWRRDADVHYLNQESTKHADTNWWTHYACNYSFSALDTACLVCTLTKQNLNSELGKALNYKRSPSTYIERVVYFLLLRVSTYLQFIWKWRKQQWMCEHEVECYWWTYGHVLRGIAFNVFLNLPLYARYRNPTESKRYYKWR